MKLFYHGTIEKEFYQEKYFGDGCFRSGPSECRNGCGDDGKKEEKGETYRAAEFGWYLCGGIQAGENAEFVK